MTRYPMYTNRGGWNRAILPGIILAGLSGMLFAGCGAESALPQIGTSQIHFMDGEQFSISSREACAGRTDYISNSLRPDGGLFSLSCIGGKCVSVQLVYDKQGIDRPAALNAVKHMLPSDAPGTSEHDARELSCKVPNPTEFFYYGNTYRAEFGYDKSGSKVMWVNAWCDEDGRNAPSL